MGKQKATLKELQQLVVYLNFLCKVVAPGWVFWRSLHLLHHRLCITSSMHADIQVWQAFLGSFNGVSFSREDLWLETEVQVTYDAVGFSRFRVLGFFFSCGQQCPMEWPEDWGPADWTTDLIFLEFPPILIAVWLWGKELADHSPLWVRQLGGGSCN